MKTEYNDRIHETSSLALFGTRLQDPEIICKPKIARGIYLLRVREAPHHPLGRAGTIATTSHESTVFKRPVLSLGPPRKPDQRRLTLALKIPYKNL